MAVMMGKITKMWDNGRFRNATLSHTQYDLKRKKKLKHKLLFQKGTFFLQ